jgi:eukaryotic-like serine/threonine-protein kinase
MANLDAAGLAKRACMLGLLTEVQVQECQEDPECKPNDPGSLLRVMERKAYLTPWQSQKLAKGESDGYFVGGYRLLYKIASGTFGRVYRADNPKTGQVVAVKVLRQRWTDNPHGVELFLREGQVGLTLRHDNIVRILAVDRDPLTKQHYIVMEFIEGGSLRDFLAIRRKLTVFEALRLTEDAASGLAHAYSKGLTHRDLKPTNMLISSQGAIKLVDFGLARLSPGRGAAGEDEKMERTVDYAGLEKATGAQAGDIRSDIYFLGCVLYEMLTGRPPMTPTKDKAARMQRERYEATQRITPEEVKQPAVIALVETMMAMDPLRRYQTPAKLLEAIQDVRAEVQGKPKAQKVARTRHLFIVEANQKLQDAFRTKFKELGYRVLISNDPTRAPARFQQQPFDSLIMDVGSAGEDALMAFRQVMEDSEKRQYPCVGILLLNEDQTEWKNRVVANERTAVMVRPVTLRQLYTKVNELLDAVEAQQA